MIPPIQMRGVEPIIVSNAASRSGGMSCAAGSAQHEEGEQDRDDQRHEAEQHQPVGGLAGRTARRPRSR